MVKKLIYINPHPLPRTTVRRKGENLSVLMYLLGTMTCFYIAGHITFTSSYSCNAVTTTSPVEKGVASPNVITGNSMLSEKELVIVSKKNGLPVKVSKLRFEFLMVWAVLGFIAACFIYGATFRISIKRSNMLASSSMVGFMYGMIFGLIPSWLLWTAMNNAIFLTSCEAASRPKIVGIGCMASGLAGMISGLVALKIRLLPDKH
jgi:hypothetical protein